MEIQGSELNALRGATEILKNQKPALTIMMFHCEDNLITIPQFIASVQSDYKIFLRKHSRFYMGEYILYAIP